MIRITKMTDYGIVLLSRLAISPDSKAYSVKGLAEAANLPEPTVSKLLKALTKSGLLVSTRGVNGGYGLARKPEQISVAQIIAAIDGPIAITDCSGELPDRCEHERMCPVRSNWQKINLAIRDSLEGVTLAQMAGSLPANFVPLRSIAGCETSRPHIEVLKS